MMAVIRAFVTSFGYGVAWLSTAALSWGLHQYDVPTFLNVAGITVAGAAGLTWLEAVHPARHDWGATLKSAAMDLVHSLVTSAGSAQLARALIMGAVASASIALSEAWGATLWPTSWPFALQLGFAVLVSDLGAYIGHRTLHAVGWGWRLHAVHHTTERFNFWASGRSHPLNGAITFGLETGAVVLLGIPADVLVVLTSLKSVNAMLQHSNVDFQPGWLSRILATNVAHAWHHAYHPPQGRVVNFGNTTTVWDQVFGTFHVPADDALPPALGNEDVDIPEHYGWHLIAPFVFHRFRRSPVPKPNR